MLLVIERVQIGYSFMVVSVAWCLHLYSVYRYQSTDHVIASHEQRKRTIPRGKRPTPTFKEEGRPPEDDLAEDKEDVDMELGSHRIFETREEGAGEPRHERPISYRDTLQKNNPNMNMDMRDNLIWAEANYDDVSKDDEPSTEDDPTCPTILLTSTEKRML